MKSASLRTARELSARRLHIASVARVGAILFAGFLISACGDDMLPPPVEDAGRPDGALDAAMDLGVDAGLPDLAVCPDDDGDGVASAACGGADCDDADPSRYPGATEVCDADDEDCDDTTFGADGDTDGDGHAAVGCCNGAACGDDCDDARDDVNPRATEACNAGLDDDCDGLADAADGACVPCAPGYLGFDGNCVDVDECAAGGFCGTGAAGCTNVPGSYVCSCAPGYAPASLVGGRCANVDECAGPSNPCGAGACTDNAGSYLCACPAGYRLEVTPFVTCADVDECAERGDDCDEAPIAACRNTDGSFTCACPAGYEGDGRGASGCADVDECALDMDDCDAALASCRNTVGGFACTCPAGFVGAGRGEGGCRLDDPSLSGLEAGLGATLGPVFAPGTTAYNLALPRGRASVTLLPRVAYPERATITVDGVVVPSGAPTVVTLDGFAPRVVPIVVTTETGATRTYALAARRTSLYAKASNTGFDDAFGHSVALSADGNVLAVGAIGEASDATGVGGNQNSDAAFEAGAVYVFRRSASGSWAQEAYVKASNTDPGDRFGATVALSADGAALAVGAYFENFSTGAVYVFRRAGGAWAQEAFVRGANTEFGDNFGISLSLAADGSRLAVGAYIEDSSATGVGGDPVNNDVENAGAVYVFERSAAGIWSQSAYVKASNTDAYDVFGAAVALSGDGDSLAVGAYGESSSATGIGGDELNNAAFQSGAVYVFRRGATGWSQEVYVKTLDASVFDGFGRALALSVDGTTLAVGAPGESSAIPGIDGDSTNDAASGSGATYVFRRGVAGWSQEAFVKSSNPAFSDGFGRALALSADGSELAVGAPGEDSSATGIGGRQSSNAAPDAGAVYVFRRGAAGWSQQAYVKASNTGAYDTFGSSVALSADGASLAVGAPGDESSATGFDGDETDDSERRAGAVHLF
jgi:hypothetical protein